MNKIMSTFIICGIFFIPDTKTRHHIKIEHKSIEILDGSMLLDEQTIRDCLYSGHHTTELIKGKYDAQTKTYTKYYRLADRYVGLYDLVELEKHYNECNIAENNPLRKELNACLLEMKEAFKKIQEPLLEKASKSSMQQKTSFELMNEWMKKAGREDSLLKYWGSKNQFEPLYQATATEFYQFCLDLKHFLEDLIYSCPKARELYKQIYLKSDPIKCAHFDKAFAHH